MRLCLYTHAENLISALVSMISFQPQLLCYVLGLQAKYVLTKISWLIESERIIYKLILCSGRWLRRASNVVVGMINHGWLHHPAVTLKMPKLPIVVHGTKSMYSLCRAFLCFTLCFGYFGFMIFPRGYPRTRLIDHCICLCQPLSPQRWSTVAVSMNTSSPSLNASMSMRPCAMYS
jgi:hypothetical protein